MATCRWMAAPACVGQLEGRFGSACDCVKAPAREGPAERRPCFRFDNRTQSIFCPISVLNLTQPLSWQFALHCGAHRGDGGCGMAKGVVAPEGSSRNTAKLVGTFSAPVPLCLGDVYVSKLPTDARSLVSSPSENVVHTCTAHRHSLSISSRVDAEAECRHVLRLNNTAVFAPTAFTPQL